MTLLLLMKCPPCKLQARLQLLIVDQGRSGIAVPKE